MSLACVGLLDPNIAQLHLSPTASYLAKLKSINVKSGDVTVFKHCRQSRWTICGAKEDEGHVLTSIPEELTAKDGRAKVRETILIWLAALIIETNKKRVYTPT